MREEIAISQDITIIPLHSYNVRLHSKFDECSIQIELEEMPALIEFFESFLKKHKDNQGALL